MDEIKAMLESLVQGCLKARNEDEKTDKRKLIDEVAGIMKSAGADDELIRTAIAKMEKLAYEKSEADTADNKAKNEEEKEEEKQIKTREVREKDEEIKEEEKEDIKAENEEDEEEKKEGECLYKEFKEKVEKEAANKCKKAKNSLDEFKKEFFKGKTAKTTSYVSQAAGIELGKELY